MKAHWRVVDALEDLNASFHARTCALCGYADTYESFESVESECAFFGGKLRRHRCPSCGVIFGPQKMLRLDDQMLDLEYRNLYRIYAESDSTELVIRTFNLLDPKRDGAYLDFGCGGEWSASVEKLRNEGWNIFGFEPSAINSSAHVFSKWEEVEAQRFDGILSHNVLEHLFDPIGTTARLSKLLNPGGRLVHATPCFEYVYDYSRFHVFFFTGNSPEVLAERAGMKIVQWEHDGLFHACVLQARQ